MFTVRLTIAVYILWSIVVKRRLLRINRKVLRIQRRLKHLPQTGGAFAEIMRGRPSTSAECRS
jgi:hypothetical protein